MTRRESCDTNAWRALCNSGGVRICAADPVHRQRSDFVGIGFFHDPTLLAGPTSLVAATSPFLATATSLPSPLLLPSPHLFSSSISSSRDGARGWLYSSPRPVVLWPGPGGFPRLGHRPQHLLPWSIKPSSSTRAAVRPSLAHLGFSHVDPQDTVHEARQTNRSQVRAGGLSSCAAVLILCSSFTPLTPRVQPSRAQRIARVAGARPSIQTPSRRETQG